MSHPEETCQRCGNPNILSWSVDSDRFNAAMEALELTRAAIVCPSCFVEGHEKATGLRPHWVLVPDMFRWIDSGDPDPPEVVDLYELSPTDVPFLNVLNEEPHVAGF